ncbi:transcription elongation factor GreA [Paraburkholderia elongata]|nr:transcription elongation factor GreA [Paraburkholderia elongata]
MIVSRKLATLHELQTVYGAQDLYDLLEVIIVDDYNARIMSERKE